MLATLATLLIYGFIAFAILDVCLYLLVKIKEKKIKKQIENNIPPIIDVDLKDITEPNKKP